jgi:hypothetical protein
VKLWIILLAIWAAPAAIAGIALLWFALRDRAWDARRSKRHSNRRS